MDVDLARTFLAVVETGTFLDAAERVFVTQSTVSARIKTLEERLGRVLFERSKAGASLTPAGHQFMRHAEAMVRIWEHARLDVALPEGYQITLSVGGQYSLWDGFLVGWLAQLRQKAPDVAVRASLGLSGDLMQALVAGALDVGIMYTPQGRPGFEVEQLFEDELVMVTTRPDDETLPPENYILIDWGPEFLADHAVNFPRLELPGTFLSLGSLSLNYLTASGSAGYVPRRLVSLQLKEGTVRLVKDAPVFRYPAYLVYPSDSNDEFAQTVLNPLRQEARRLRERGQII